MIDGLCGKHQRPSLGRPLAAQQRQHALALFGGELTRDRLALCLLVRHPRTLSSGRNSGGAHLVAAAAIIGVAAAVAVAATVTTAVAAAIIAVLVAFTVTSRGSVGGRLPALAPTRVADMNVGAAGLDRRDLVRSEIRLGRARQRQARAITGEGGNVRHVMPRAALTDSVAEPTTLLNVEDARLEPLPPC